MPRVISSFTGEHAFLSNFYLTPILCEKLLYPSAEHAFQAMKTTEIRLRELFTDPTMTPGNAKRAGRRLVLRAGWDDLRIAMMYRVLLVKFAEGKLRKKLVTTYPHNLVEGNTWHDTFWGACIGCYRCEGNDGASTTGMLGENNLGKLLMTIRESCMKGIL